MIASPRPDDDDDDEQLPYLLVGVGSALGIAERVFAFSLADISAVQPGRE